MQRDPLVQRAYAECAEGYGFKIDPCPPARSGRRRASSKRGSSTSRATSCPRAAFRDLADLNAQARRWVMDEAGVRIHGTTREQPLALFALEQPLLRALPAIAPDLGTWHRVRVHRDCHVQFDWCFYSAPFTLVGQALVAARHRRARWRSIRTIGRSPCIRAAASAGSASLCAITCRPRRKPSSLTTATGASSQAPSDRPGVHANSIEQLLADRIVERLRAAQGVLRLAERYGAARAGSRLPARARARQPLLPHRQDDPRRRLRPAAAVHRRQPAPPYARGARFARDAERSVRRRPASSVH